MQKKKNKKKKQKENGGALDWESFKTCRSVCLPQGSYHFSCASHLAPRLWKSRTLVLWLFLLGLGMSLTTGSMSYLFTTSLSCQACLMSWCCLEQRNFSNFLFVLVDVCGSFIKYIFQFSFINHIGDTLIFDFIICFISHIVQNLGRKSTFPIRGKENSPVIYRPPY